MTRKKSTLQVIKPDDDAHEKHLRENFIHVTITVGTPWDPDGKHLQWRENIPRLVFELADYPCIPQLVANAAQQLENAVRYELMPRAKGDQ